MATVVETVENALKTLHNARDEFRDEAKRLRDLQQSLTAQQESLTAQQESLTAQQESLTAQQESLTAQMSDMKKQLTQTKDMLPKLVKVYTERHVVKNTGADTPGKWTIDYSTQGFTEIYACFAVFQGFGLWNGLEAEDFRHHPDAVYIPQLAYVRVDGFDTKAAQGRAYCSESSAGYEGDNCVLFTLVVLGKV